MLEHILQNCRIVLVNTSHPGNIGSAARAMKTMGLSDLCLVDPIDFPHPKAYELASGAQDILANAKIVPNLKEAIADANLVIGTSARLRAIPWPLVNPRELAAKIALEPATSQIALVFGREHSGLSNEELQSCHLHVQIPANPQYSSLNLASAVQVIAYELRMAHIVAETTPTVWDNRLATMVEMEQLMAHLQSVLVEINFLRLDAPRQLMTRLRRFLLRARPDIMEVNILRGIFSAIEDMKRHT
jgi:tRNA (cytidine32/uridine32-2'-O)-methyltransferase